MPGAIKVAGTQRTIAVPQIKVLGTWRPATIAYVKVNGTWRIWHSSAIADNFNRANSSSLGIASNGFSQWTTLKGTWGIVSNRARSSTDIKTPLLTAIATTSTYKFTNNVTLKVDLPDGTGTGVAFWIEDADNWWGAQSWENVTTAKSGGYYYCSDASFPNVLNQCVSFFSDSSYLTTVETFRYTGCRTADFCSDSYANSTWSLNCSNCYCNPSGSGGAGTYYGDCYEITYTTGCSAGRYNGSTCVFSSTSPALYEPVFSTNTVTRKVRILSFYRKAPGIPQVTVVAEKTLTDRARSLEVTTSGFNVTVKAYSGALQTGLLDTLTASSGQPIRETSLVGIIKGPTDSNQGSAVDNFSAV